MDVHACIANLKGAQVEDTLKKVMDARVLASSDLLSKAERWIKISAASPDTSFVSRLSLLQRISNPELRTQGSTNVLFAVQVIGVVRGG